jgi:hypothetical protein
MARLRFTRLRVLPLPVWRGVSSILYVWLRAGRALLGRLA